MSRNHWIVVFAFLCIFSLALVANKATASKSAQVSVTDQAVSAETSTTAAPSDGTLIITTPDGKLIEQPFTAGSDPIAAVNARATLADGNYSWETRLTPILSAETMDAIRAARNADADTRAALVAQLRASGALPDPNSLIQSGGFAIVDGAMADITLQEVSTAADSAASTSATGVDGADGGARDQVIVDDLIVDGSTCIGLDCVNGENFGFDTLRVKENNLRVNFNDTSSSASFPGSDWTITSNDSSNGGRNYLAFSEDNAGYLSFVIAAGAGENALYVGSDGRVGFGTSTPAADLHISEGDTPTIRFDQDGTAGFQQQAWNMSANEASFALQDSTNASTPLRVFAGAPDNALVVDATGNVGVGFITPTVKLEVDGDVMVHGTVTELSDRNAKENIAAVDAQHMLYQLLNIPVYQWNYIKDDASKQHIGPMAQDVFAQTGIGTDTTLASLDVNGMLIAGVQALNAEISAQDATIEALETENADLIARLEVLEAAVEQILSEGE